MAYDALVFDLDGTLWNTLLPVTRAWNEVARESRGIPEVSTEQIRAVMGLSHEEAFARLLPGISPQEREKAAPIFYDREVKLLVENYLYGGVGEGLRALEKKYVLALVSNCQPEYLRRFFELTGLGVHFKDAECHGGTGLTKGENISLVLRRNGLSQGAYVGDTAGDQIAARQAGVDYYHVTYGFGAPAQECSYFNSFTELTQFFESLKA
ncbi:HAD family hydrolase [bacterium]|nr:HAD family hydrolase [bacterium]